MSDHLTCQVVKQLGMAEVIDIIEIHQGMDDVILQACLLDASLGRQGELLIGAQHLAHDFPRARLQVQACYIQLEWMKTGRDFTFGHHCYARYIDALINHNFRGFGDNSD
ncbi:hypothetical protein D3C85_1001000 [compost metagenome]